MSLQMQRLRTALAVVLAGSLIAGHGHAAPSSTYDDEGDDDNAPQQHAPAPPVPAPAPAKPAASAAPVIESPPPQPAPSPPVAEAAPVVAPPPETETAPIPQAQPTPQPPPTPETAPVAAAAPAPPPPAALLPAVGTPPQPVVTPTGPTSAMVHVPAAPAATPASLAVPAKIQPLPPLPAEPVAPPDPKIAELGSGVDRVLAGFGQHNQQLSTLRQQRSQIALGYYQATGDISARLATGTAPNDPNMLARLQRAHQLLDMLQGNIDQLNGVSTELAADSSQVLGLAQDMRTQLSVPGKSAVDRNGFAADDRRISAAQAEINQALQGVQNELQRQNQMVGVQRQSLDLIAREIQSGGLVSDRGLVASTAPAEPAPMPATYDEAASSHALLVIASNAAGRSYESKLYAAVSGVLKRSPGASFTVRAVTPAHDDGAKHALEANDVMLKADDVARSLATLGLSRSRIRQVSTDDATIATPEVEIFAGAAP